MPELFAETERHKKGTPMALLNRADSRCSSFFGLTKPLE